MEPNDNIALMKNYTGAQKIEKCGLEPHWMRQ